MYNAAYHTGNAGSLQHPLHYPLDQSATMDNDDDHDAPRHYSEDEVISEDKSDRGNEGGGSVLASIPRSGLNLVSSLLSTGAHLFYRERQCVQMGEGPTLLCFLCFLGGLAMVASSFISAINVFSILSSPSTYVLQLYQGFFGLITMIVEAKNWDCFDQFKPWMSNWFRFLTVPSGKGAFYLFIGSLGVSVWIGNLLTFTIGVYMTFMGIVCIAVHAGTNWSSGNDARPRAEEAVANSFHDSEGFYDEEDDQPPTRYVGPKDKFRYVTTSTNTTIPMTTF